MQTAEARLDIYTRRLGHLQHNGSAVDIVRQLIQTALSQAKAADDGLRILLRQLHQEMESLQRLVAEYQLISTRANMILPSSCDDREAQAAELANRVLDSIRMAYIYWCNILAAGYALRKGLEGGSSAIRGILSDFTKNLDDRIQVNEAEIKYNQNIAASTRHVSILLISVARYR